MELSLVFELTHLSGDFEPRWKRVRDVVVLFFIPPFLERKKTDRHNPIACLETKGKTDGGQLLITKGILFLESQNIM